LQQTMNGKFQKEPAFANYWFCRGYTDWATFVFSSVSRTILLSSHQLHADSHSAISNT
jgi:hypothetical protein